jgi:hypothetical protein
VKKAPTVFLLVVCIRTGNSHMVHTSRLCRFVSQASLDPPPPPPPPTHTHTQPDSTYPGQMSPPHTHTHAARFNISRSNESNAFLSVFYSQVRGSKVVNSVRGCFIFSIEIEYFSSFEIELFIYIHIYIYIYIYIQQT